MDYSVATDIDVDIVEPTEPSLKKPRLAAALDTGNALVGMDDVVLMPISTSRTTAWLSIVIRLQYAVIKGGLKTLMLLVPALEGPGKVRNKAIALDSTGRAQTQDKIIRFPILPGALEANIVTNDIPRIVSVIRSTNVGLVKLVDGNVLKVVGIVDPTSVATARAGVKCESAEGEEKIVSLEHVESITWTAPVSIVPISRPEDITPIVPCAAHYSGVHCKRTLDGRLSIVVHGRSYDLLERPRDRTVDENEHFPLVYMCRDADGEGSVPTLVSLPADYVIPSAPLSIAMKISAQDVVANVNSNMQSSIGDVRLDGRTSGKVTAAQTSVARLSGYDHVSGQELPGRESMTRHLPALVSNRREITRDTSYGTSSSLCCYGLACKDEAATSLLSKAILPTLDTSREAGYAPYVTSVDTWVEHAGLGDLASKTPVERVSRLESWASTIRSLTKEKQENRARYMH